MGISFALGVLECCARMLPSSWGEGRSRFCEYHDQLGWIGKPFARGRFSSSDFSTEIVQNSAGLRGPEIATDRVAREKRVLVLGDSFAWGFGVEESERFSDVARGLLPGVHVINAGCSGWGTDQELLYYQATGRSYNPDLVVVMMHLRSDLKNNISSTQYGFHKPVAWREGEQLQFKNIPVPQSSRGYHLVRLLDKYSAAWRWLSDREFRGSSLDTLFADLANLVLRDSESPTMASNMPAVDATCELSSTLAANVARDGSRALFVLIPDVQEGTNRFVDSPLYPELASCLVRAHLDVLDLTEAFRERFAKNPQELLVFEHDLHWNVAGHGFVGELLARRINAIVEGGIQAVSAEGTSQ